MHVLENDFGRTAYPFVGGHELLGKVTAIGDAVSRVQVGDIIGVGCFVDSCLSCNSCKSGDEQYCEGGGIVGTYGGVRGKYGRVPGNQVSERSEASQSTS